MPDSYIFYPLTTDTWGDAERAAAIAVIESGRTTMGEKVRAFEAEFASMVGARHAGDRAHGPGFKPLIGKDRGGRLDQGRTGRIRRPARGSCDLGQRAGGFRFERS